MNEKRNKQIPDIGEKVKTSIAPQVYVNPKADAIRRVGFNLLESFNKEKALTDEEIEDRIIEFFERCFNAGELPVFEEMAMSIGYDVNTILNWEKGVNCSARRSAIIQKAKALIASFEAKMVLEGNIKATPYIFRAKNFLGMRDEVAHVVQAANPLGQLESPDDIRKRLAASVEDGELDSE